MYIILFIIFYLFAINGEQWPFKNKMLFVAVSCVVIAIGGGLAPYVSDRAIYALDFMTAESLFSDISESVYHYKEKGFIWLTRFIKTFIDNYRIYFILVSGLTFLFLYKSFKDYCIYPLIGLCVYLVRFQIGRNLQIRAGLSYAILLLGTKYIQEKKIWKFLLVIFIAYLFHRSAIIALPLYFICNWIEIKKKWIYIGLAFAFLFGTFGQGIAHNFIEDNASDLNIGARYTEAGGEKQYFQGLGMSNPVIYYQSFFLIVYTFLEEKLKSNKYYYVLRNGYFMSTLILICFCSYRVLSGRTSSIFATYEIAIVPTLVFMLNKRERGYAYFGLGVILTLLLYLNLK